MVIILTPTGVASHKCMIIPLSFASFGLIIYL